MQIKSIIPSILLVFQLTSITPPQAAYTFGSRQPHPRAQAARNTIAPFRHKKTGRLLWPGTRFTDRDRAHALYRGLKFIYRTARDPDNFSEYGSDYLWCFYTLSATVQDENLRRMARRMGVERAHQWRREHRTLPPDANASIVSDFAFGSDAADHLNVRDDQLKQQIRRAAAHFSARDYLDFDPLTEPPPTDVPDECEYDGASNPRGSKICALCKRPLAMKTRYDVWYDALITTYTGDRYGVKLGAHYTNVLKWLPTLRPYRGSENGANPEFYDTVYAITHIVYTLNDYSVYRLSPRWLPQEYEFLRSNLKEAVRGGDSDMLGEFMDTLKSLGATRDDPRIRMGMEYLLSHQNRDGSWGNVDEEDIYDRYHPTWSGITGLSEYRWRRGEGLSFPELKPMLELWANGQR